jgi:hypothetical protein
MRKGEIEPQICININKNNFLGQITIKEQVTFLVLWIFYIMKIAV